MDKGTGKTIVRSEYPKDSEREITISKEEYEDLLRTESRVSILRCEIISILEDTLDKEKETGHIGGYYSVRKQDVNIEKICNYLGFLPTMRGFIERENQLLNQEENEDSEEDS